MTALLLVTADIPAPLEDTMSKIRRTAAIVAAIVMGALAVPALASAAPMPTTTFRAQYGFVRIANGAEYARSSNAAIDRAVLRIFSAANGSRLDATQRQLLKNNTVNSAQMLKARVASVSKDGVVTAADRQQVVDLANALQAELRKAHGNLDSFWLL